MPEGQAAARPNGKNNNLKNTRAVLRTNPLSTL